MLFKANLCLHFESVQHVDIFRRSSYDQAAMAAAEEEQTKGETALKYQHLSQCKITSMHLCECCIGLIWKITQLNLNEPILVKKITAPLVIAHTAHMNTHYTLYKRISSGVCSPYWKNTALGIRYHPISDIKVFKDQMRIGREVEQVRLKVSMTLHTTSRERI